MRTTVHVLRHGEVFNPSGVLYGRLPGFRLSEDGLKMAVDAAEALRGRDVTEVVSSPLERAQQTAAPIAAVYGLAPRIDDRLIESENHFEGSTFGVGDGALSRPSHWPYLWNPFTPSWGEAYRDVARRMLHSVEETRDRNLGHEAVCVSHQLPIWTLRRYVEGRRLWHRPDRRLCGLASLTSLTWEDERLVQVLYSEPAGEASRRPGHGA